jgi:hypothetical protein
MSNQATLSKSSNTPGDMENEVDKLIKKYSEVPDSKYRIVKELQTKYKDEEVRDLILSRFHEKMDRVKHVAEKIKNKLIFKYPNLSVKEYIKKITPYKTKYNITDSEMNLIINLLFKINVNKHSVVEYEQPYTEMSKALGFEPASLNLGGKIVVKPDEMEHLQAILQLNGLTKELHNQVSLQSLVYTDVSTRALSGAVDKSKVNIFSFVHPVVVALFLPKIELLDAHMLQASISNIIAQKYNGNELTTQPEYELFMDMSLDPAETACTGGKPKPFADLLNRCQVQTKLWQAVLNLRQGKYYTDDLSSFILAVDNCKSNVFDAADFAYVKDEGTIMRKLFGAFSLRPTIVNTAPIYGVNSLTTNCSALAGISASHITTVSMLCMRIKTFGVNAVLPANPVVRLSDALQQQQFFMHKGQVTIKQQQVLYSRELVVFYVHRRFHQVDLNRITSPYTVAILPMTMSSYERINQTPVDFDRYVDIATQRFNLKSIVALETVRSGVNDLIIGCSTYVVAQLTQGRDGGYKYAPLCARTLTNNAAPGRVEPMGLVLYSGLNVDSFMSAGRSNGTLFIYTTVV